MTIETVTDLLDALHRGDFLEPGQLDDLTQDASLTAKDARTVARDLIHRGWLTAFQVNQLLAGREKTLRFGSYLLLARLGQGGMGDVYRARDTKLGRIVALKLIRPERLTNPETVRRFLREVKLAAKLSHPNFVHALDADQIDGIPYLVMEYVDGMDLSRLVKLWGPLPVNLACECIRQAAGALEHAHQLGMVHRDIKPSNLLLAKPRRPVAPGEHIASTVASPGAVALEVLGFDASDLQLLTIKVLDMGLARMLPSLAVAETTGITREGTVIGTPDFMSPEQACDSRSADIRSDLYSLGCTFYYLLTGKPPFPGSSMTAKLVQHQKDEPVPIEQHRPEVPAGVVGIVRRLMAKHPAQRYQTPGELIAALNLLSAEPVTLRRASDPSSSNAVTLEPVNPTPLSKGNLSDTLVPADAAPPSDMTAPMLAISPAPGPAPVPRSPVSPLSSSPSGPPSPSPQPALAAGGPCQDEAAERGWSIINEGNPALVSPKFSPEGTPALPQRNQARVILIGVGVGMVLLLAVLTFLSLSGESTTPTIPRAPRPTLAVNPLVQFTHALHIHCGKGMGKQQDQVKLPGFNFQLIQGELHDDWKPPAARSHRWSHPKEVVFELTMPPGTTGKLKLHFVDGGLAGDVKQKLTVAGNFIGEYEGFIGTGKHVEVPITAANTREGKLRVSIEAVSKAACVSTVELLHPAPKNPPATSPQ